MPTTVPSPAASAGPDPSPLSDGGRRFLAQQADLVSEARKRGVRVQVSQIDGPKGHRGLHVIFRPAFGRRHLLAWWPGSGTWLRQQTGERGQAADGFGALALAVAALGGTFLHSPLGAGQEARIQTRPAATERS
jgi:hypothetical protein